MSSIDGSSSVVYKVNLLAFMITTTIFVPTFASVHT